MYSAKSYYEITLMRLLTIVIFAHSVEIQHIQHIQIVQKLLRTRMFDT